MSPSTPEWLTSEQAAEILDYHVEYVRRLAREGKLEGRKFGTAWMIRASAVHELEQLLEEQESKGFSKNDPRRRRE